MFLAIILALITTVITGSSNILLKKGFHRIHPFIAVYLSTALSTLFLWSAILISASKIFFGNITGISIFIIVGTFTPTLVRTLTYHGIHKLGVSKAALLRALTPFFAVLIAIFFLRESPSPTIFIGIIFIVSGVTLLTKKEMVDFAEWKPMHYIFSISAALLAGVAVNLRKFGLAIMPHPIFALAIATTTSFIILTCYIFVRPTTNMVVSLNNRHELKFIFFAAVLTSVGEIVDLFALFYGKVSLVVPIFAITPVMIILLNYIFLKKFEIVTHKLVLATILIVSGVYLTIKSVT